MSRAAICVKNLGKLYRIGPQERYRTLRDSVTAALHAPFRAIGASLNGERGAVGRQPLNSFWALKDVSLEVGHGEAVGIIGSNGAGKTTLLKILSRITQPTEGRAEVYGRVGSLLEVGTGFHPELTGRENIYLNGAVLGMKKREIERRFDEIVAFAGVEKFLDTPVKHFSSGMYLRLAFAVAAHLEQEILLADEVLAVGDLAFQKKCLGKMASVAREGRTVVFVSHNMAAVQSLCNKAYLLERGRLCASGDIASVLRRYLETVSNTEPTSISGRRDRQGNGQLRFDEFSAASGGKTTSTLVCGAPAQLVIRYQGTLPLRNVEVSAGVYTLIGEGVLHLSSDITENRFDRIPARGAFVCSFPKLALLPGTYMVSLYCTVNGILSDWVTDAARVQVVEGKYFRTGKLPPNGYGSVLVDHDWEVVEE